MTPSPTIISKRSPSKGPKPGSVLRRHAQRFKSTPKSLERKLAVERLKQATSRWREWYSDPENIWKPEAVGIPYWNPDCEVIYKTEGTSYTFFPDVCHSLMKCGHSAELLPIEPTGTIDSAVHDILQLRGQEDRDISSFGSFGPSIQEARSPLRRKPK